MNIQPKNITSYDTITLLLAEKRTSLAVLRTGIAVFTLPLSVFTVLVATSGYYDVATSLHFIIPLIIICITLAFLGIYLIIRSFRRLKEIDRKIQEIKTKETNIQDILEN
ncbi:MAG: hypothetical protein JW771_03420 [Candidatus Thermoplasmatota archaeon]|nr:hypothetical protein [Candidatus Thermoplasmatota archaeon]